MTLTLWGHWVEFDFYIPEDGETVRDEVLFLSGSFEGQVMAIRPGQNDDGVVTTYVMGEFRGVTDGWGKDRGYWGDRMEQVCEDARPMGW